MRSVPSDTSDNLDAAEASDGRAHMDEALIIRTYPTLSDTKRIGSGTGKSLGRSS